MIVVFVEDGFIVVFVPFIELKDKLLVIDSVDTLKNVEVGKYVCLKVAVGMVDVFVNDAFMVAIVPVIELKNEVGLMVSLVSFKKVDDVGR